VCNSTSELGYGNIASMAWGARNLISTQVADALLQTAAQEKLGPDWRALVARDESLDEDAVPAFLRKECDVRWVDA
jgi:hypothetical protein